MRLNIFDYTIKYQKARFAALHLQRLERYSDYLFAFNLHIGLVNYVLYDFQVTDYRYVFERFE